MEANNYEFIYAWHNYNHKHYNIYSFIAHNIVTNYAHHGDVVASVKDSSATRFSEWFLLWILWKQFIFFAVPSDLFLYIKFACFYHLLRGH